MSKGAGIDRRDLLAFGLSTGLSAAAPASRSAPNILHIMTDQQQWATIGGRSQCRTPHLNQLADEGMTFERPYTPSAVCCPARAMILSGAYHWHNGVFNQIHSSPSVHRDMYPDVVLYANRLKDVGYRLGYTGKWHASWTRGPAHFGYEMAAVQGCDPAALRGYNLNPDDVPAAKQKLRLHPLRMMQWPGSEPFVQWGYSEGEEESTAAWRTAESARRMLKRFAAEDKPWMIEAHFELPHDPYLPLKKYLDRYDPRQFQVPESFYDRFEGKPYMHRRESATWGHVTEEDYRQGLACYYAYVEQVDQQVGRVLDALNETGQQDNTIVVFTSDHGDMCGSHRMWIKGWIPYEECYRVPLIIRWPGRIRPGSQTSALVQTHDLAHTYVAAAGAPPLPFADGRSLLPLFAASGGAGPEWRDQAMCAYYGGEFLYTQRIAITKRFKYVFNGFDMDELYDFDSDPHEMHNAVSDPAYAKYADDMRARLYEMMSAVEDPYGLPPAWHSAGDRPNRYGAPRYLSRGKRIES